MKVQPKKGKGERFLECPHDPSCLDFAVAQNWKAFNCESCGFYIETLQKPPAATVKQENTRICAECDKTTISPKHPLCASCMARRSNKSRPKKKGGIQGKDKAEKVQQRGNLELTIRFGKYASLLTEIEKMAEEEVRPPDLQVIYILKTYLNNTKVVKST
jgi:hypothetical protein